MEKIWLIGTGVMSIEYAKMLIALNVEFLAIGQSSENAINFEKQTMHPVIQGGLEEFLESNPETPAAVIVTVGVEILAQTKQLLIDYGIKKILLDSVEIKSVLTNSLEQKPDYSLFTIIIPTYNRPEYLKRILSYYESFEVKIIVVDASDEIFPYLALYKDQIEYRHTLNKDRISRINEIASLICTPYVLLCADDDFIIPDAVNRVVSFLQENPDYALGEGYIFKFYNQNNDLMCIASSKNMLGVNISEDCPSKRILYAVTNPVAIFYSVYRTDIFKEMYKSMILNNKTIIKHPNLQEMYISWYSLIEGKFIVLPLLYQAREATWNSEGQTSTDLKEIISTKKFRKEYNEFVALVAAHLSKKESISFDNAKNTVEEIIMRALYVSYPNYYTIRKRIIPEIKYRLRVIVKYPIKVFLRIIGLYDYTKKIVNKYRIKKHSLKTSIDINAFNPDDSFDKQDMEQWKKIRDCIIQSKASNQ